MKLQFGFFDESNRLRRLSNMGDPLERIAHVVDFKIFRPVLDGVFKREDKAQTGRPPFDSILMFKILLLQQWYGIADDKTKHLHKRRKRSTKSAYGNKIVLLKPQNAKKITLEFMTGWKNNFFRGAVI